MSTLYLSLNADQQREIISNLVEESELPVSGWEGMSDVRRHSAPSPKKIRDYWEDTLISLDLFDSRKELDEPICWAHGYVVDSLERAHILSWQQGGSWEPSNFHLLCHLCHKVSENLYGEEYWEWFLKVNGASVHRMITLWRSHPDKTTSLTAQFSRRVWNMCSEDIREEAEDFLSNREPHAWIDKWRDRTLSNRTLTGVKAKLYFVYG